MIPTTYQYNQLAQDNARLKIGATITVQGYDANDNPIYFRFEPEQILSFDYHIWEDPVGRELPGIELKWTEFYTGRIDEDSITEKYKAALPLMRVNAMLKQQMIPKTYKGTGKVATFEDLPNIEDTNPGDVYETELWGVFYINNGYSSWVPLAIDEYTETEDGWEVTTTDAEYIPLQTLFLVGTPEVNGHTITWTARDLLSLLNDNICRYFDVENSEELDYFDYNPVVYALLQERRNMSKYSLNYLLTFAYNIYNSGRLSEESQYELFNDQTKNCLMNYFSARGKYLSYRYSYGAYNEETGEREAPDFGDYTLRNSSVNLLNFADVTTPSDNIIDCPIRLMKDYPKVTNGANISAYNYTEHDLRFVGSFRYVKDTAYYTTTISTPSGATVPILRIDHEGYGVRNSIVESGYYISADASSKTAVLTPKIPHCISFDPSVTIYTLVNQTEQQLQNDRIHTLKYTSSEKTVNLSQDGETFTEDNPMLEWSQNPSDRLDNLTAWFNEENKAIEFTQLPNLSIEVGDTISVETNLYKDNKPIKYLAYVLDVQLSFNGGLWQKIICHTIGKDERENNNE